MVLIDTRFQINFNVFGYFDIVVFFFSVSLEAHLNGFFKNEKMGFGKVKTEKWDNNIIIIHFPQPFAALFQDYSLLSSQLK